MINLTEQLSPEDLQALFPNEDFLEYKDAVLRTLQIYVEAGATDIEFSVTGSGDSGDCFDLYASNAAYKEVRPAEDTEDLENYTWNLAPHCVPGYEINDGGGVRVTLNVEEDKPTVHINGWINTISTEYYY